MLTDLIFDSIELTVMHNCISNKKFSIYLNKKNGKLNIIENKIINNKERVEFKRPNSISYYHEISENDYVILTLDNGYNRI